MGFFTLLIDKNPILAVMADLESVALTPPTIN